MSKPKIAVTNDIAWVVEHINKLYTEGHIKGLTIQLMLEEDETATMHCGDISYIEKLGMIEMAKQDLLVSALNED